MTTSIPFGSKHDKPISEGTQMLSEKKLMELRLELLHFANTANIENYLQFALDIAETLVQSPISFCHFVEEDQQTISLQQWSTNTLKNFCQVVEPKTHYNLADAGIWVDCVHKKQAVIHNNYSLVTHKKGLPEGHPMMLRDMVVPIFRGDKIVAIMGVGNKTTNYTNDDLDLLSYIADISWEIVTRKTTENELIRSEKNFRLIFERMPIGWAEHEMIFDEKGEPLDFVYLQANQAFENFTGLDHKAVIGKSAVQLIPDIRSADPDLVVVYGEVVKTGITKKMEIYFAPFERWYDITIFKSHNNYFVVMFEDVTQRKTTENQLESSNRILQRSNKELEQFAYVASHDLQEPLRMVASYTQLLAKHYKNQLDEKADKYINYAVDGAKRMQALINDLLKFSRVSTHGAEFKPVDCNQVLVEVCQNINRLMEEKNAKITIGSMPIVMGDKSQLTQVFQNLLINSIKFHGNELPVISITSEKIENQWEIKVTDNGIGIDPQFQERIFIIFQRLHERGKYEGTGIGLPLVRKIIERHGGTIRIESKKDQGSIFIITLNDFLTQEV